MYFVLSLLLLLTSLFLIALILLQRGRGGGLAGALGGAGGQSALGTKAGDMFTRITIGVAAVWILLCIISVKYMGGATENDPLDRTLGGAAAEETRDALDLGAAATGADTGAVPAAPAGGPAEGPGAEAAISGEGTGG